MRIERLAPGMDLSACRAVRQRVFVEEQSVPENLEWDGKDAEAQHLLAWDGSEAVGTLRIRIIDDAAKIERVAVDLTHRGKGIGDKLMDHALQLLRDDPQISQARLGAQLQVIPFYEKLGFEAYGPVFDDAGIPHRDMKLDL